MKGIDRSVSGNAEDIYGKSFIQKNESLKSKIILLKDKVEFLEKKKSVLEDKIVVLENEKRNLGYRLYNIENRLLKLRST
jgi:predicted nuclease with TOPRIM domain